MPDNRKAMIDRGGEVPPRLFALAGHIAKAANLQERDVEEEACLGDRAPLHVFRKRPETVETSGGGLSVAARHADRKTRPIPHAETGLRPGSGGTCSVWGAQRQGARRSLPVEALRKDSADLAAKDMLTQRERVGEGSSVF